MKYMQPSTQLNNTMSICIDLINAKSLVMWDKLRMVVNNQMGGLGFQSFRLCLVPRKFEGKCKGKKIQRKSRKKEKVKENKK